MDVGLLLLVFPVPGFSFRKPFQRSRYPFLPGLIRFGFRDPLNILTPV
jgi:hypothetical protein